MNMVLSRNSEYPNRKAEYCWGALGLVHVQKSWQAGIDILRFAIGF